MADVLVADRWEWRTFALSLARLEARIGAAARVPARDSTEIYLLGERDDLNIKVRDGALELKTLADTDGNGLELWRPSRRLTFPAPAEHIASLLAPVAFAPAAHEPVTLDAFLAIMAARRDLRSVVVAKSRRRFRIADCLAEFAEITANGETRQSFCIESESRQAVLLALASLGLSPKLNTSMPQGLKLHFNLQPAWTRPPMHDNVEIERKYLVDVSLWSPAETGTRLRQGYLSSARERVVRVRIAGDKGFLTIKGLTVGIARSEFEYEIPLSDASAMLDSLCERPLLEKTRYRERVGSKVWEIDVFHGDNEGLVIAEVELAAPDEPFETPAWATRDVSGLPRYYNNNLIAHPYKTWAATDR